MGARFFGQFLHERGVVTAEALLRAIEHQSEHNLKLGELAIAEGLLSAEDVALIHREQRCTDAQFGQLAVKLGRLEAAALERLVARQRERHVFIGQALVAIGAVGQERLDAELAEFEREQAKTRAAIVETRGAAPWAAGLVPRSFVQVTAKLLWRVADLLCKEGAPREVLGELPPADVQVAATITGGWRGDLVVRLSDRLARRLAQRVLSADDPTPAEADAAARELVQLVCAHACSALAAGGVACDAAAPRALAGREPVALPGRRAGIFPLDSTEGALEVVVAPAALARTPERAAPPARG